MYSIACFQAKTQGIVEFWTDEFEKAGGESKKAQVKCAKVEQALVEAIEANKILLQFAEESRKSLEDTKTKLKEFETREEALKAKLTTVESYAKALQQEIEHLNKDFPFFKVNIEKAEKN